MIVEILILITLWLMACAVCAVVGFFVGFKTDKVKEVKRPPEPLTETEKRKIEKARREEENFWNYSGVVQDDFNTKV